MEIFKDRKTFQNYIERNKEMGKKIGFAPTMGALHKGHLSLYEAASKENDLVISSIFVNPTQFNNQQDFDTYPRDINKDIKLLENTKLVDAVYIPRVEDIYSSGLKSKSYNFDGLENEMEGKFRPGHFDGVGTVVEELFNQTKADNAYFGEKDFQQLAIIKKMAEKLNIPVKIHGVPIYREENGLAMSSRNARLSTDEKVDSKIIYETLEKVKLWFHTLSIPQIKKNVEEIFHNQKGMELEYFIITNENDLKEVKNIEDKTIYRAFIVVYVGDVRLIDNMRML